MTLKLSASESINLLNFSLSEFRSAHLNFVEKKDADAFGILEHAVNRYSELLDSVSVRIIDGNYND